MRDLSRILDPFEAGQFPLVSAELSNQFDVNAAMVHGTLPLAIRGDDPPSFLVSYAETYLQEEIRAEALTRNIGDFGRFLEIEQGHQAIVRAEIDALTGMGFWFDFQEFDLEAG